jgi:hypothetical protein
MLRRVNEYRLGAGQRAIFDYPRIRQDQAKRIATPASSGFGDLLCAWLMPMTLAELNGWQVRIPVPANAGGRHHDASRPQITPDWLHETLALPPTVQMVAAETVPDEGAWFCALEQQWHLNSCTETSYETIPWWLRGDVDRQRYYDVYSRVAGRLLRPTPDVFEDGRPYCVLNARRADRGRPGDDDELREIVAGLTSLCRDWAVVSDDARTAATLRALLRSSGYGVAEPVDLPSAGPGSDDASDRRARLIRDFSILARAQALVCSVRGGWSAFPYAATRISGAPLIFTEPLESSIVWRVLRAHSQVPVRGIHHGSANIEEFAAECL